MNQKASYVLYGRPNSGSLAVQVALEEIGAPYSRIWVGTQAEELAAFRALNPAGKVPALGLPDGVVMFESAAILIHLATAHPAAGLAPPSGTCEHARFLQWMVYLSANVYEAVLRAYYPSRFSVRGELDAEVIRQQATGDLLSTLTFSSRALGPYLMGDTFSIADVYLYMLASWWVGDFAELKAGLPALATLIAAVGSRESVRKVETDHLPDVVG